MIVPSLYLVLVFDSCRSLCTWHWYFIRGARSVPVVAEGWVDGVLSVPGVVGGWVDSVSLYLELLRDLWRSL